MGLKTTFCTAAIFLFSVNLLAAPKLRLSTTAVGPVQVGVGATATNVPSVDAANVGDGTLNPQVSVSPSATWLTAKVGAQHSCSLSSQCFPVQFTLNTATLAAGTYSGTVTVNDPAAIDAPQTIVVTTKVGSDLPDRLDFYVAPNGNIANAYVLANSTLTTKVTTQSNLPFLTMSLAGGGSFAFAVPYNIIVNPANLTAGTYTGTIVTTGGTSVSDNKTVQVNVNVTSNPIAQAQAATTGDCTLDQPKNSQRLAGTIRCRATAGSKITYSISIANLGQGTLQVSGTTATATSGPAGWLTAANSGNAVTVTMDATSLSPGAYAGTVTVNSNAANTLTIPVQLDVNPSAGPLIYFGGVQNNATFRSGESVAQGDIVVIKGEQLATGDLMLANVVPYPTTLNNVQVFVNDKAAPLYYTLPGQLAIQIPYDAPIGDAVIKVVQNGKTSNLAGVTIAKAVPRILQLIGPWGTIGAIVNSTDGSLPYPSSITVPTFVTRPAKRGESLLIFAIGLGPTTPPVQTGAAAPGLPNLATVSGYKVQLGGGPLSSGVTVDPFFQGLAPTFAGLYQLNFTIPQNAPTGDAVFMTLVGPDGVSNQVTLAIQ